ncbi:MAG: esterase [Prolixibacteraceae bacterium]|nr:esterase [Prolixibacteraceae bacterium]
MKKMVFFVLLIAFSVNEFCYGQTGQPMVSSKLAGTQHASPNNMYGGQFPRIEADNRVTFQFTAPDALKVQVAIANVAYDMKKDENGVWTYTSEPQDYGYHNYWMVVDGAVVLDPATDGFIGYSRNCNGFEIPDPDGGFYDLKDVPHGDVLIKNYYSTVTEEWRMVYIYTPPGYNKNTSTKYPVLYLQHGGGEDQRVWIEMGRTNLIMDNLIAEGKSKPFIIVMETSAASKPGEAEQRRAAAASGDSPAPRRMSFSFDTYAELMIKDLIPFIDGNFRTLTDADNRAMAGLSMGSMVTSSVTLPNLDKFSYIGLFSGGRIAPDQITDKSKVKLVFMSFGSRERGSESIKAAADALNEAGIKGVSYVSPLTAHEWQSWRRSLREFAPLLFK